MGMGKLEGGVLLRGRGGVGADVEDFEEVEPVEENEENMRTTRWNDEGKLMDL